MAIIINIDVMLAKRKMSVTELADKVGNGGALTGSLNSGERSCRKKPLALVNW